MQLEQSFEVAHSLQAVWRALEDLRATATCIPGAEITNVEDNRKASGVFRVQLGPIKAAFAGEAEVTRDDATHSGTIKGAGRDGKNATRVNATVEYRLVPVSDPTTRIELKVDYSITGPLAQFSRAGIVKEIAGSITKMFATNLGKMLDSSAAPVAASGTAEAAAAAPVPQMPATEPQSLNFASLMLSLIWRRITGIFKSRKQ
ncbi:MAG: SRPBCC family protein [Afipia sp.]